MRLGAGRQIWRALRRWPILPLAVVVTLITVAIFAPLLAPHDPYVGELTDQTKPPAWDAAGSSKFLLGTDPLGRDILSRIIYGARVSLTLVSVVLTCGAVGGTILGLVSGYFGGMTDEIMMRAVDLTLGVPFIMVALAAVVVFGSSFPLIITLLVIFSWSGFARQARAETLRLKQTDYVALARVAGASPYRLITRHMLPGVLNTAMVIASLNVGSLILTEAALSFLGVGIPAPTPAWGSMVATGRNYIGSAYWIPLFPGLAITLVVYACNFLGDSLRDRFDPRLRQL